MRKRLAGLAVLSLLVLGSLTLLRSPALAAGPADTLHVYPGDSIQTAIVAADPGDTVLVHTGIYTERLTMKEGITLEGEGWGNTVINGGAPVFGGSVISVPNGVSAGTVISGVQLTNGHAAFGGCLWTGDGAPVIRNTWLNDCMAALNGGGAAVIGGAPTFDNVPAWFNSAVCGGGFYIADGAHVTMTSPSMAGTNGTLLWNYATDGAGICVVESTLTLDGLRFGWNTAGRWGGAIHADGAGGRISGSLIVSNTSQYSGGGVSVAGAPKTLTLFNNWLERNYAQFYGGGLQVAGGASPSIDANGFFSNTAMTGGGIDLTGAGVVTLTNNLIARNSATIVSRTAAGIAATQSAMRLINNIICDNFGDGVWFNRAEGTRIINNIIVNNHDTPVPQPGSGIEMSLTGGSTADYQIDYNDVWVNGEGGDYTNVSPGIHDVGVNPLIVGGATDLFSFYHLRLDSPVAFAGSIAWAPPYDIDHQERRPDGVVSMGADEIFRAYLPLVRR